MALKDNLEQKESKQAELYDLSTLIDKSTGFINSNHPAWKLHETTLRYVRFESLDATLPCEFSLLHGRYDHYKARFEKQKVSSVPYDKKEGDLILKTTLLDAASLFTEAGVEIQVKDLNNKPVETYKFGEVPTRLYNQAVANLLANDWYKLTNHNTTTLGSDGQLSSKTCAIFNGFLNELTKVIVQDEAAKHLKTELFGFIKADRELTRPQGYIELCSCTKHGVVEFFTWPYDKVDPYSIFAAQPKKKPHSKMKDDKGKAQGSVQYSKSEPYSLEINGIKLTRADIQNIHDFCEVSDIAKDLESEYPNVKGAELMDLAYEVHSQKREWQMMAGAQEPDITEFAVQAADEVGIDLTGKKKSPSQIDRRDDVR